MTKLTLSADKDLVRRAKRVAAARRTSLSAMVSRFLEMLTSESGAKRKLPPLTRRASGLVRLPADTTLAELMGDALADKYDRRP